VLLAGLVSSASLRALLPATLLLTVALALGVDWPGLPAIALTAVLVMGLAAAAACYAIILALRFRTQQAAPLMQVGTFVAVLFTTAYAPRELLSDWLRAIADVNPVTHVLEGVRQGFVGDVTWAMTWPALLAVAGLVTVFGALAVRGMSRQGI
jgi:ABC-2 type transport system permease protein